MNPNLDKLQPYPFAKINKLLADVEPPKDLNAINFAIGEPRHQPPAFVLDVLTNNLSELGAYPLTRGTGALRKSISDWLTGRFCIPDHWLDPDKHVLTVNGTREALFAFAQTVVDPCRQPLVLSPNPFYQIYEGAALLAGAETHFLNTVEENGFIPDFEAVPSDVWQRCQLIYLCSPGNPTGAVFPLQTLQSLIHLADEYDFIIAGDECYSELYPDEADPPPGLLQACAAMGREDFSRCVVFHSLSKRSNLPGLRSGFVAGDAHVLDRFLLYRTYHGCAMSLPVQHASQAAWEDENHVKENRALYRQKFEAVLNILSPVMDVKQPDAGFYLWAKTPYADDLFARDLFAAQHLNVVPGSYLARDTIAGNPGRDRIRLALVAEPQQCIEGARRLRHFVESLSC